MNRTVTLPEFVYRRVVEQANAQKRAPLDFLIDFLDDHLAPQHPYIERVHRSGGWRPVIKRTRTGVDAVVGDQRVGYTPEEIAEDVLPHLDLAQVYDALSYYEDYSGRNGRVRGGQYSQSLAGPAHQRAWAGAS